MVNEVDREGDERHLGADTLQGRCLLRSCEARVLDLFEESVGGKYNIPRVFPEIVDRG